MNIKEILNKSTSATCGFMEREINVKDANVSRTKSTLRNAGFNVIGTSENDSGPSRKVWFIRRGGF